MLTTDELRKFRRQVEAIYGRMAELLCAKRQSYGTDNLTKFGTFGIVVRMSDKIERLVTMHADGARVNADGDTMRDAFQDILGYATLALKLMDDEAVQIRLGESLKAASGGVPRHPDVPEELPEALPEHRPMPEALSKAKRG